MADQETEKDLGVIEEQRLKRPSRYKVILHNDDYTTMDFVVLVLKSFFQKSSVEAEQIMMKIHKEGRALCGVYTHEVAESKVFKVNHFAREHGHPLKCTMEAE